MRIVLFTGKGGVGKTTTAAAAAVHAARAGISTLVMSTDAAHSLGDALGHDLGGVGPVELEPHLHALQVSAHHAVDPAWRTVQDYLLQVLATVGVDPVVAEELTSLPGAEEIAALLELRAQAESGRWDLVVVDCAPTAETLRLLALPEALAWHLERLLPGQRGLLRTLRPAAAAAAGMPLPGAAVAATIKGWNVQMRDLQALLTSDRASVRLVLTPERVVIAESRRTWTSLSLYGFVVDQVIVNRVFPDAAAGVSGRTKPDPWLSAWNAAQREGLDEVGDSFAGVPVLTSPYLAHEPIGVDALDALAQLRGDDVASLLAPVRRRGLTVRRAGDEYVLTLPLPLVRAAEVDLKRRDAELLVVVGDHRRVLTLPAVLKRCVVKSAAVKDGTLRVRFVPDGALWPIRQPADGEATA
ncbi:ArsA family ATPase [Lapillicoccus sp.]|uniref:ArsA family ATPase n=1 Tax=Lapillicoccus sp. TaxID=1909287 RepID=UPI003983C338